MRLALAVCTAVVLTATTARPTSATVGESCVATDGPEQVAAGDADLTPSADDLRPPSESDLRALTNVLQALRSEKTASRTLEELSAGRPFSRSRFGVLASDARLLLAALHASETLSQMKGIRDIAPEIRKWSEDSLRAMQVCGRERFDSRGGLPTYERSMALIQKLRQQLEPAVLDTASGGWRLSTAPQGTPR
jgi:hypothetical protein